MRRPWLACDWRSLPAGSSRNESGREQVRGDSYDRGALRREGGMFVGELAAGRRSSSAWGARPATWARRSPSSGRATRHDWGSAEATVTAPGSVLPPRRTQEGRQNESRCQRMPASRRTAAGPAAPAQGRCPSAGSPDLRCRLSGARRKGGCCTDGPRLPAKRPDGGAGWPLDRAVVRRPDGPMRCKATSRPCSCEPRGSRRRRHLPGLWPLETTGLEQRWARRRTARRTRTAGMASESQATHRGT